MFQIAKKTEPNSRSFVTWLSTTVCDLFVVSCAESEVVNVKQYNIPSTNDTLDDISNKGILAKRWYVCLNVMAGPLSTSASYLPNTGRMSGEDPHLAEYQVN